MSFEKRRVLGGQAPRDGVDDHASFPQEETVGPYAEAQKVSNQIPQTNIKQEKKTLKRHLMDGLWKVFVPGDACGS